MLVRYYSSEHKRTKKTNIKLKKMKIIVCNYQILLIQKIVLVGPIVAVMCQQEMMTNLHKIDLK